MIRRLFKRRQPRREPLEVGKRAPQWLLDGDHPPLGGWVKVCPTCQTVEGIFIP